MSTDPSLHTTTSAPGMADIFFVPAPARVIPEMLKIADVKADDLVMDLGSGDGQILIAAARDCGARGVGVEIDPALVKQAQAAAEAAGVSGRLEFRVDDFFEADLRPASVLMLYLLDSINVRLRPKILRECRPGTRVVTYSFEMGEWQCDAHVPIAANGVSLWIVPADLSGEWQVSRAASGTGTLALSLVQRFQELSGSVLLNGTRCPVISGRVCANDFSLAIEHSDGPLTITGRVDGDRMHAAGGSFEDLAGEWLAVRKAGPATGL